MADEQRDRWWVFDRPVHADGMFWSGVALGVILVVLGVSSSRFSDLPSIVQVIDVLVRSIAGIFIVGVVGGSYRNFRRAYRDA
jgi:hypothetical protein